MMKYETMRLRFVGTKRLLMHSGRLADPLDPVTRDLARLTAKRPKTIADHQEISRTEWYGSLWLHGDRACVPAEALMATMVGGAKSLKKGLDVAAGVDIEQHAPLLYDGPQDIDELWECGDFKFRAGVKVGVNKKTMRTRPCFRDWRVEFTVNYLPSVVDPEVVVEACTYAGIRRGLGDWRPQNGKFLVERIE